MNSIQLYIEEHLDPERLNKLKKLIMEIEHVIDVEVSSQSRHEFVVDYEEHHNMPMILIDVLRSEGYHPDIVSG